MNTRLGLCSAYSLLFGVHSPKRLIEKSFEYGVKTASVCDINNLYGVHSFLEAAKEAGIRPVIGAALTKGESSRPAVYCFVENRAGFARLCEILTERNKDIPAFDPVSRLRENSGGLILASSNGETLRNLAGWAKRLYAAITPDDSGGLGPHKTLPLPLAFLDTSAFLDASDMGIYE